MTPPLTVNQVLDDLVVLDGQPMEVTGLLVAHEEGWSLQHFPVRERRMAELWLGFGRGSLQPNAKALARWAGKRVRVHGVLHVPEPGLGCGPWGGCPAEIEPYGIQRTGRVHKDAQAAAPAAPDA